MEDKKKLLESILFLENNPVSLFDLEEMLEVGSLELSALISSLEESLKQRQSALELETMEEKIYLRPQKDLLEKLSELYGEKEKSRFSRAALEVLSIVAWKQPLTRSEVEAIRGVDSSNSLRNLIGEGYLRVVGKKELPGRPQTYGTTEKFLRYFGLSSLEELPRIEDLKEMFDEN
jgi:segregation and condensation protein B